MKRKAGALVPYQSGAVSPYIQDLAQQAGALAARINAGDLSVPFAAGKSLIAAGPQILNTAQDLAEAGQLIFSAGKQLWDNRPWKTNGKSNGYQTLEPAQRKNGKALQQAPMKRKASYVPPKKRGYMRTGGYYGRFKGPYKEKKFFDTALTFNFDATGEVPATGQLMLIPQGDDQSSRDGMKAFIKSINIRANVLFQPGAGATAATTVFLFLVQDTQCNGAAAAITDVLTSSNISTALRNIANGSRFKILKKWKWTFNSPAGVTTAFNNVTRSFEWFKKCNITGVYNGATGAITEIRSDNLFLLAGTDGSSDDTVAFAGNCRLRFYD